MRQKNYAVQQTGSLLVGKKKPVLPREIQGLYEVCPVDYEVIPCMAVLRHEKRIRRIRNRRRKIDTESPCKENREYVRNMAPEKYWDALIPNTEIGCRRKVLDTDYLTCLHRLNVELIAGPPVLELIRLS